MAKLSNIGYLGVKELRSLWSDKVLFAFVILSFSFMVYTSGKAGSLELHNAPIAVVDEDHSELSSRIIEAFFPPYFMPPQEIAFKDIDPTLDHGRYTFVLVIPEHFERDARAGRAPSIQVDIDATRMSQAFVGATHIQNIVSDEVSHFLSPGGRAPQLPIQLVTRVSFNPNLNGVWFGGVMEIISEVTLLSIILTGAALIREREHGTIEHLLVMPLTPAEIMLAKVWSNGLVVLVAAGLSLWLVVRHLLGVPIAGSTALFLFGAALNLFSTTSIGILLGTVARSMPQLGLLMILVILPLQLLSGGITPRESMPLLVQHIMSVAPTTHFVSLAQAVLYRGAGLEVIWPQLLALFGIGCVFFMASLLLFRRSLALSR
ncbi:ABC transporter permease [Mangrovitalea sediminis]|uniref:ABC transporter permease n=1 Tax=Mangrovitalea sediminis TaxID=1982043 RepID=UPI000BE620B1|nr:ABC transporter permease [Mangrovitalea sediminis]